MMISPILRRHLIPILRAFLVALSLLSTVSHGQGEIKGTPVPPSSATQTGINPSLVEQTLVPESVLVMQLIEALNLGPVADSAKAEDLLSSLGIEPENGWIAEYPVTPQVLGDVEQGIAMAGDQGKIAFNKEQALKLFRDVKLRLGFDIKPDLKPSAGLIKKPGKTSVYIYTDTNGVTHFTDDHDSIPREYLKTTKRISRSTPPQGVSSVANTPAETSVTRYNEPLPPEEIDYHYDEQGPPVVTYYAPPDTYTSLYSWVAYPFWSTGRYFPGYYVMNDFNRRVLYNRQHYDVKHHARNGPAFSHARHGSRGNRIWQGQSKPRKKDYAPGFTRPKAKSGARANVKANQYPNGSRHGDGCFSKETIEKVEFIFRKFQNLGQYHDCSERSNDETKRPFQVYSAFRRKKFKPAVFQSAVLRTEHAQV